MQAVRFCLWLSTPRIYKLFREFAKLVSKSALIYYPIRYVVQKIENYAKRKHPTNDFDIEFNAVPFLTQPRQVQSGNFWCLPTHGSGLSKVKRKERICDVQKVGQEWEDVYSTKGNKEKKPSTHTLNNNSYEGTLEKNDKSTHDKLHITRIRIRSSSFLTNIFFSEQFCNAACPKKNRSDSTHRIFSFLSKLRQQCKWRHAVNLFIRPFFVRSCLGFEVVPGGSPSVSVRNGARASDAWN